MRRMTPSRFPETLAFLMRRRALSRLGTIGALALSPQLHAGHSNDRVLRIVCAGGALTEIIYALKAEHCLVGVDATSTYPVEALSLPQIGYARSLSAEGVLALNPTHVFATEEAGPTSVLRQIASAGVSIEQMDSGYRFEGLIERITRIGKLLSRESQSSLVSQHLQLEWERVLASFAMTELPPPRAIFLFAHSTNRLLAAGTHTGADAMMTYAGAINAVSGFSGYKPLTPESLVAAQPEVLMLTEHSVRALGGLANVFKLPGVSQTPAGRNRRIASMDASLLLGFGPRLPAAVQMLRSKLIGS